MSSRLIYGCMTIGGSWDDAPHDAATVDRARAAVHAALDAGITDFDHADIYAHGKSEAVFGELLAEDPALAGRVRLQTKCGVRLPGNTAAPGAPAHYRLDRGTIRAGLEGSLRRLRVDSVERFMLHRPDPLADPHEVADALDELRREGLIRSVGLSNMSTRQVALYQQLLTTPVTALQLELSLRHRGFVEQQILANHPEGAEHSFPEGILEYCAADGIEVQAWGALARGLYTGAPIPPEDQHAAATAETVHRIAAAHAVSGEAVVLAWLMRHPGGIRPVLGTTDPRRIAACAEAEALAPRLGHEDWYALLTAARGNPVP
ncbi:MULTISPECIES: aldo/keto reductase family oxidoreductase [Kocuria]|uniref:Aldo/keto reductase family oxidoreductase n=1 Tax=Kocuria oceani TaxID=988827 RepID=A0ABV9TL08_9MICC|nr:MULTISPECIES: aldo/keto reductase [Kocuria]